MPLHFELEATDPTGARAGRLHTRRGVVQTPVFMPVATHAEIRGMHSTEVWDTGARILLSNTYHLMLRPGADVFRKLSGIHSMMQWDGLVLTDSGGFQIFSLPDRREITEQGALFRSFYDNSRQMLSPETSIAMQQAIGSDIMMVLDVCINSTTEEAGTKEAMERTHRWAVRSLAARDAVPTGQALFGIVQGGVFPHLRKESAAFLTELPFEGFAVGGLAVGEGREIRNEICELSTGLLPANKPRYLMGVGTPNDLLDCVRRGVDMFDCIIPTKMAQQGYAYTFTGLLRVTRSVFRLDDGPLDASCQCFVCTRYTRGYLHHLMRGSHALGARLLAIHNVTHYQVLMQKMRAAIQQGTFDALYQELFPLLKRTEKGQG
ncbi:MAG: tRNA guanosine(34) transglycosylase Tgt [Polyangia bacterium]|jgi:queuine tRNA-ribosyltransferase